MMKKVESAEDERKRLRQRQLLDVLRTFALYEKSGVFGDISPKDDGFEATISKELAVQLSIDINGAKKIFKLSGLIHNDEVCEFLKSNGRLGVFFDHHFTKRYSSISKSGGNLCIEFLEAFMNGEDPQCHEVKLGDRANRRKLDAIALRFTSDARDAFVGMFFKSVAVIATLCSFVPSDIQKRNIVSLGDILQRYLSPAWNSDARQRTYHKDAVAAHLVDGWHIVGEVFKIASQELVFSIIGEGDTICTEEVPIEGEARRVDTSDLSSNAHQICEALVLELSAWMFQMFCSDDRTVTTDVFPGDMFEVLSLLGEKLGKDLGCATEVKIRLDKLRALLGEMYNDAPTMADVKYDVAGMRPTKREKRLSRKRSKTLWDTRSILQRARWEDTKVLKSYETFLRTAPQCHFAPGPADETVIPETPPPTPPPSDVKILKKRPLSNDDNSDDRQVLGDRKRVRQRSSIHEPISNVSTEGSTGLTEESKRSLHGKRNDNFPSHSGGPVLSGRGEASRPPLQIHRPRLDLSHGLQLFYEVVLGWPIMPIPSTLNLNLEFPVTRIEEYAASNLLRNDQKWLSIFMHRRGTSILPDASHSTKIQDYIEHWRHILHIEARGNISSAIEEITPIAKDTFSEKNWTADIEKGRFIRAKVDDVSPTKGLYHVKCQTTNPDNNNRIARELQGGTICIGYVEHTSTGNHSPLVLILCRSVDWDKDDVISNGLEDEIDFLEMRLTISRDRLRDSGGVWKENCVVHLCHLCHFAPYVRMFQAVMDVDRLPSLIKDVLCGNRDCKGGPVVRRQSVSKHIVDVGCEEYLKRVHDTTGLLDESQMEAMRSILSNVGRCERDSSSVSMVQGPPGTGKTTLILLLIGALCHHSVVGHVGREQYHVLKDVVKDDDIMRCSKNEMGVRFLLCGPSNQSVNNLIRRIDVDGIPDGKGGTFRPLVVRLARDGYDYEDVSHLSFREQGLIYDRKLYNPNEISRRSPSAPARRALSNESVVISSTLCTSGGDRLKNMRTSYDILIVDESGQALEPETLIPIVKMARNVGGPDEFGKSNWRRHVVLVGDPEQLPPVDHGTNVIVKSGRRRSFNYDVHTQSLMERLMRGDLASCKMLETQYRMHPCIAALHSPLFYDGKVRSILNSQHFDEPYNRGCDNTQGGFAPVTMIDTSKLPQREEMSNRKGAIVNLLEVDIIDEVLYELKKISGDGFEKLRNQVSVLLPYRAQVDHARLVLERFGKYGEGGRVSRQGYQIKVDTVDSMQGSERDVVIIGATRSNIEQQVGFVDCMKRLNVALSRARKLLIVVADMSTFETTTAFENVREHCITARDGALMLVRVPEGRLVLGNLK